MLATHSQTDLTSNEQVVHRSSKFYNLREPTRSDQHKTMSLRVKLLKKYQEGKSVSCKFV
jgi:hypothetical protein